MLILLNTGKKQQNLFKKKPKTPEITKVGLLMKLNDNNQYTKPKFDDVINSKIEQSN